MLRGQWDPPDFGAAWRAGDVGRLMSFMTGDCVLRASVGTGPGTVFQGRDEVRRGFELMLAYDEGAEAHGGLAAACALQPRPPR
jgi:ketosteroid isomerase-like protein